MKGIARSALPQIEAGIRQKPNDRFLWNLWTEYSSQLEYRQFMAFKETLLPAPYTTALDEGIPPGPVFRNMTLDKYVKRADWLGIIDLQEWRWEEARRGTDQHIPTRLFWSMGWKQLLEAYLRLGMDSKATELVRDINRSSDKWREHRAFAVELAKKCGKDALAKEWGKL
jgi:hypothetical protein